MNRIIFLKSQICVDLIFQRFHNKYIDIDMIVYFSILYYLEITHRHIFPMKKVSESRKRTISDTKAVTLNISKDVIGFEKIKKTFCKLKLKKKILLKVANFIYNRGPEIFGGNKPGRLATRKIDSIYCWFRDYGGQFIHIVKTNYPDIWKELVKLSPTISTADVIKILHNNIPESSKNYELNLLDDIYMEQNNISDDDLMENFHFLL
ncbi:hypothetical protein TRFO_03179 [Tritrichomonas foetus]|uniref:Uncharacterized protein n=1 Tax=Tritrichomonas foetus TaxID=1144522 RepID=A0A1J4KX59_9EUKA|nr:hypothetical protein TRFO_03179 [Tritrichomonas foetus]|eukprot:OHT14141.1 hypothetical protein TRFO_03179 [Tritrichomonas foetus]